jgi:hypothetical protein
MAVGVVVASKFVEWRAKSGGANSVPFYRGLRLKATKVVSGEW